MAGITLEEVSKTYGNGFEAVTNLNLDIKDGEFLVMVGPSGCGKSTTLRMIAGLEEITQGVLKIGNRVVNNMQPKDRDVAMVFQNYALYPHMTVQSNMGFALKLQKLGKEEIRRRVEEIAQLLQLTEQLDKKPAQLSGGQRQRVAMGRAIARLPQVFLLDEPLSNLDTKLRVEMRAEISDLQRKVGVTTLYVTHDQAEAMTMADRVAVINRGVLQQVTEPQGLYDQPKNIFVASFIGSPPMNLLEAHIDHDNRKIRLGSQSLDLPTDILIQRPKLSSYSGRTVTVGIRPDDLKETTLLPKNPAKVRIRASIDSIDTLGTERIVYFHLDAKPVHSENALGRDDDTGLSTAMSARLAGRFSASSDVRIGDTIEIAVNTEKLHFFDPFSGLAIR